jgi:hypothetical protein
MNDKVGDHFIIEQHDWPSDIVTKFLLNSFNFSLPGVDMTSNY